MTTTHATFPPAIPAAHVPPASPVEASAVRLSLAPVRDRRGPVDGAWWPRSTDAAAELPGLIAAVDQRLGEMTLRVGLHVEAWDNIPHRIPAPGRAVRVGWFRSMDTRLVTLSLRGRPGITLQLIPPQATEASAKAVFAPDAVDADGEISAGLPVAGRSTTQDRSGTSRPRREGDAGQADWENEGGTGDIREGGPAVTAGPGADQAVPATGSACSAAAMSRLTGN
ncbi:DUF5994 family protein [Planomonospora sp. ID67723]|uniref:DUF5994 family protein n=1 Tax=Planomonospora sp. ID67723 TaxID=2738134 RepID=UPI0035A97621